MSSGWNQFDAAAVATIRLVYLSSSRAAAAAAATVQACGL